MIKNQKLKPRRKNRRQSNRGGAGPVRFTQLLLREWRKLGLPDANATVVVAVSGGADSVALLLALDGSIKSGRLKIKIVVAHLNHKLRDKMGDADARWVTALSKKLGRAVVAGASDVKKRAAKSGDNLEQAARRARYEFLAKTARAAQARIVVTAHTMDDQAETVLMNLLRGSGADGLSGIEAVRPIQAGSKTLLARPLVSWARRADTEDFCRLHSVDFRVDEMNADENFARVRVRRQLVPLMKSFNPKLVEGLARTAEILREDSQALDAAAERLLELSSAGIAAPRAQDSLRVDLLSLAPPALRRRALRRWIARRRGDLRRLERVHIVAVEKLLFGAVGGRVVELPGGGRILRRRGELHYRAES